MPLFETGRVELPDDKHVDIRELSVEELQEADAKGTEAAATLMGLLPEKLVENQMNRNRDMAMERMIRYEGYDPVTLLRYGMTGWSFKDDFTDENRAKLSAKQGEVVARAIFDLSVIPQGEVSASSLKSGTDESSGGSVSKPTTSTEREASSHLATIGQPPADS